MSLVQVSGLKRCTCCGAEKDIALFPKRNGSKVGVKPDCKACHNAKNRAYRLANPEKAAESSRKWQASNPDKAEAKRQRWLASHPGAEAKRMRKRRAEHPERVREIGRLSEKKRNKQVAHRLRKRFAEAIRITLKTGKGGRKTFEILGYSAKQLARHLELQFIDGMSWQNYGDWHVDHITPLKLLPYESIHDENFKAAWCLSNLRPLWALDNMKKRDKRTHLI